MGLVEGAGYLLGLDVGMSKSVAALSDGDGNLLATRRGEGMTLLGPPTEDQLGVLRDLVSKVCSEAGIGTQELAHVAAGMSGVDFEKEWEGQHRTLCRGLDLDRGRTSLVNDAIVALWGATRAERATIVQQGSAYTSAYRAGLGGERLFDPFDYARLFDVRREALARAIRMLDGRAPLTGFAVRLLEHFGVRDLDGLYELLAPFGGGWSTLSTIGTVVSAAWLDGDPAAAEMMEVLAADLSVTVRAMADRIGPGPFEAAFGGGVLRRFAPEFLDFVGNRLRRHCPDAVVVGVALPPEEGALVMAAHQAGTDPTEFFCVMERRHAAANDRGAP